jgi:hypothetical protein
MFGEKLLKLSIALSAKLNSYNPLSIFTSMGKNIYKQTPIYSYIHTKFQYVFTELLYKLPLTLTLFILLLLLSKLYFVFSFIFACSKLLKNLF